MRGSDRRPETRGASTEVPVPAQALRRSAMDAASTPIAVARRSRDAPKQQSPAWIVGIVGFALAAWWSCASLFPTGWTRRPSLVWRRGAWSRPSTHVGCWGTSETRPNLGHDGKFFFAQANDPLSLQPERHAAFLDGPLYRAQRMLFPLIAGGFGLFPPGVVVWSMLVTNLLAMGVGALLAARLAIRWGVPVAGPRVAVEHRPDP